jgi:hypothetical protein
VFDPVAIADAPAGQVDARILRREHGQVRPVPQQFGCTADVVGVVVREQHQYRAQALRGGGQYRRGFAWIDEDDAPAVGVLQRPDVVVGNRGQRLEADRQGPGRGTGR